MNGLPENGLVRLRQIIGGMAPALAITHAGQASSGMATADAPTTSQAVCAAGVVTLPDGTTFGVIASTTAPFCRACDRSRLTADGTWFLCLYAADGVDLREPLRLGASDDELAAILRRHWEARVDRGAEERRAVPGRAALYGIEGLRADPRREMHTRGG